MRRRDDAMCLSFACLCLCVRRTPRRQQLAAGIKQQTTGATTTKNIYVCKYVYTTEIYEKRVNMCNGMLEKRAVTKISHASKKN